MKPTQPLLSIRNAMRATREMCASITAITAMALTVAMANVPLNACGGHSPDSKFPPPPPPGSAPPPVAAGSGDRGGAAGAESDTTADPAASGPVDPNTPYIIHVIDGDERSVKLTSYSFPYKDVAKRAAYQPMVLLLTKLPSKAKLDEGIRAYRMADGHALAPSAPWDAVSGRNLGLIVVPATLLERFPDEPSALSYINSQLAK